MVTNYKKYAAASDAAKTFALTVRGISGYFNGAVNSYLLFFDAKAVPANGTVPLRGFPIYPTAPFAQPWTEEFEVSNGLVWAVSTTLATLTISAETVDVFIEVDSAYDDTGLSIAGDYTTGREFLTVWASASGPKYLRRLYVKNNSLAPVGLAYMQIHAKDTPTVATSIVFADSGPLSDGGEKEWYFGEAGLDVHKKISGTLHQGCRVVISSTRNTLTEWGGDEFNIRAEYK